MRQTRPTSRVAAAAFPVEMILLTTLVLIFGLMSVTAHAATTRSSSFNNVATYSLSNISAHDMKFQGSAVSINDETRAALGHQSYDKTFLLNGTLTRPSVFGTAERPVNLYMSAGAGLAVQDRSYIEASSPSGVTPAFKVGMGLKYSF